MATAADISKVKALTGVSDDDKIAVLLDDAEEYVLAYTGRSRIPDGLRRTVREAAIVALNRLGTEGESSRSEAGESYSFDDSPKHIIDAMNRYRLAKIGGIAYERKADEMAEG